MKHFCLIGIFYFFILALTAQEVTTTYTEETADTTESKWVSQYNYIIRAQEEKTQLIKINLLKFILKEHYLIAYERKIKPLWSFEIGAGYSRENLNITGDSRENINISGGIRYYYNMNQRILKGKSANNFSANYISVELKDNFGIYNNTDNYSSDLYLLYGLQRRLGKYGFIDFHVGSGFNLLDGSRVLALHLALGLGF